MILNGRIKGLIGWLCSCAFVLVGFLCATRAQQNPKGAVDPVQAANKMAAMTHDWIKGKASSPGTSIDIRETMRAKDGGRLIVKYNAYVNGAPKDQTYTLVQWPTNAPGPSEILRGLSISAEGLLVCVGRTPEQCGEADKQDDPVNLTFLPGQRRNTATGLNIHRSRYESVLRYCPRSDRPERQRLQPGSNPIDSKIRVSIDSCERI